MQYHWILRFIWSTGPPFRQWDLVFWYTYRLMTTKLNSTLNKSSPNAKGSWRLWKIEAIFKTGSILKCCKPLPLILPREVEKNGSRARGPPDWILSWLSKIFNFPKNWMYTILSFFGMKMRDYFPENFAERVVILHNCP